MQGVQKSGWRASQRSEADSQSGDLREVTGRKIPRAVRRDGRIGGMGKRGGMGRVFSAVTSTFSGLPTALHKRSFEFHSNMCKFVNKVYTCTPYQ